MTSIQLGDFDPFAEAYARARPGYPSALADRLIAGAGVRAGDAVVELGAGTGVFTRLLAARGLAVTAVDPSAAMRAQAPSLPGVAWRDGTFEATGLPDGAFRWATAAQAFHWADPARALPELKRILAPGGAFTALWNNRQNEADPVVAASRATIRRLVPEFDENYRARDWPGVLTAGGHFASVRYDEERHIVPMSRERFLELWKSHNRLNAFAGPARMAEILAEIVAHIDRSGAAVVPVTYLCRAWTCRRD